MIWPKMSSRKPSTPLSNQKRTELNIASLTSGFRQLRSGWNGKKEHMYHCLRMGEYCQADVNSIADFQLLGGRRPCLPRPSAQMYQSALGLVRDERERWNHGCWSDVWLRTRSNITRMPR